MTLDLQARSLARGLDISLRVEHGETLALLGPNGAGKSSTLAIIAGLLRPDSGRARLGKLPLFDIGPGAPGLWVSPHRRGVSLLAQEPLLFPHLSVLDNVAFAPRSAGRSREAARTAARSWLATVGAADLEAARHPAELSGGQAQRVAIARALASEPRLLLLDEPLGSLDAAAAPAVRHTLREVLSGRTAIIVTHEMLDALSLADRVVVIHNGQVVEHGPTREVLEHPRHPFTAEVAGLNLTTGVSTTDGLRLADGAHLVSKHPIPPGLAAAAAFRPGAVSVHTQPDASLNVLRVRVTGLEPRSELVRIRANALYADITPGRAADLGLGPEQQAYFVIHPTDIVVYPLSPP